MTLFERKLGALVEEAQGRGLLDSGTARSLAALAAERESRKGWLSLASVLAFLGGGVAVLGVILLVAANWQDLRGAVKIVGFLILLAATHAGGLWIQSSGRPFPKTAAAFHFLGAGLFLAGVGLISQIYQLNEHPPNAILMWLVAILPLAFLLRSPSIAAMAAFALVLWCHMEGSSVASSLHMSGFTPFLVMEIGLGAALLSLSAWMKVLDASICWVLRASGTLILSYGLWALGFYRRFHTGGSATEGGWILPGTALLLGFAGILAVRNAITPHAPGLRKYLVALLLSLLAICALALWLHPGSEANDFGLAENSVSAAAWILWFLLALWCVAVGARSGRKAYLNGGAAAVGLGVITRFFDLIGGMAETGTIFVIGGILLLATAWATEKWRRSIAAGMEDTKKCA